MFHKSKLYIFTALILVIFFLPTKTYASNFTTDYSVTYTVGEKQLTHVVFTITLTNTSSRAIANSYVMKIGFNDIQNLKIVEKKEQINPQLTKTNDGYMITAVFNTKAVGLGTKLPFTVSFDTRDVAKQYGKALEINIPGIANPDDFSLFTVQVKIPSSFGNPSYSKPRSATNDLIFTKNQLGKSGISITFGKEQLYAFTLKYHLYNNILWSQQTIALPPATNYQDVALTDIEPKPKSITRDGNGNVIAYYHVPWFRTELITVHGVARVQLTPKQEILSQADMQKNILAKPYWETNDQGVQKLAQQLKTPQAIYAYVVKKLSYDFSRVTHDKPRLGAVRSLQNPKSAACREFTDLFIALSRAAGIPAREVDGFAYTENPTQRPISLVRDILHAWPEYYDATKKAWIMIDPTWGNTTGGVDYFTTLDVDHLAFVVKGEDSSSPLPAGGYKSSQNFQEKDVSVTFANNFPKSKAF